MHVELIPQPRFGAPVPSQSFCSGDTPPLLRFLRGRPSHTPALVRRRTDTAPLGLQTLTSTVRFAAARRLDREPAGVLPGRTPRTAMAAQPANARAVLRGCTVVPSRVTTRVHLLPSDRLYLAFDKEDEGEGMNWRLCPSASPHPSLPRNLHFPEEHGPALAAANPDRVLLLGEQRMLEAYELIDAARGASGDMDVERLHCHCSDQPG